MVWMMQSAITKQSASSWSALYPDQNTGTTSVFSCGVWCDLLGVRVPVRESSVAAWPHHSIEMIFSHKSDKAVREREQAKDSDWVIQLWDYSGSDFSWKGRETNRFHSHQWVWLLPPVFLNALKYPYSLPFSLYHSLLPSFYLLLCPICFRSLWFFLNDLCLLSCIRDQIDLVFIQSQRIRSDSISWTPGCFALILPKSCELHG